MRLRIALHVIFGTLVAVAAIFFSSSVVAGPGRGLAAIVEAQRHVPVLWLFDVCAAGFIPLMWCFAITVNHYQRLAEYQAAQHLEQLNDMIERTLDLEQTNDAHADQIERLQAEMSRRFNDLASQVAALEAVEQTRRDVFEMEMRRFTETIHRSLQVQLDANQDQVEAVSASLQFHRSELRRLRHQVRELQTAAPPSDVRRSPPSHSDAAPANRTKRVRRDRRRGAD